MVLPWCGAGQWLASGTERDVCCDDREDKPGGQEPPPVKFGSKVERNYPHLEQSHQLQDSKVHVRGSWYVRDKNLSPSDIVET